MSGLSFSDLHNPLEFSTWRSNRHIVFDRSAVEFLIPAPHPYPHTYHVFPFQQGTHHPPSYLGPEHRSQPHSPPPSTSYLLLHLSASHIDSVSSLIQILLCSCAAAPAPRLDCQNGLLTVLSSFSVSSLAACFPYNIQNDLKYKNKNKTRLYHSTA